MIVKIYQSILRILIATSVILLAVWIYIAQPSSTENQASSLQVDAARLRNHVETLSASTFLRNYEETDHLNKCADYIAKHFAQAGAVTELQAFTVKGKRYFNVIGRFGKDKAQTVIIGAHYDAAQGTRGADDNASGVAGLIELAYLIGKHAPDSGVELVAYSLEEPPFFATKMMGSAVHAASVRGMNNIKGVIVLEMIGYFDDQPGSQSYPMPLLSLFYPDRGDFIAVVGKTDQRTFTKQIKIAMNGATDLPVYSINAPEFIPGIDFSDHRSYWPYGFNAVMITDTAFYRNKAYHKINDTPDRLDYDRMSKVVAGVFEAIKKL